MRRDRENQGMFEGSQACQADLDPIRASPYGPAASDTTGCTNKPDRRQHLTTGTEPFKRNACVIGGVHRRPCRGIHASIGVQAEHHGGWDRDPQRQSGWTTSAFVSNRSKAIVRIPSRARARDCARGSRRESPRHRTRKGPRVRARRSHAPVSFTRGHTARFQAFFDPGVPSGSARRGNQEISGILGS